MLLTRWTGKWKHIAYAGNHQPAAYLSRPFGADLIGMYSTGFGACCCLAVLAGRINKHHGDYYAGALAHLDAGNIRGLDIPTFIAGTSYTAADIASLSNQNSWSVAIILAGDENHLTGYYQAPILDALKQAIPNLNDRCITVYRDIYICHGFGITRKGWVGVPSFGHSRISSPLPEDA
jgi:hypothetical protein